MLAPDALSRNPVPVGLIDVPESTDDTWYMELVKQVREKPEEYEKFALR